MPGGRRPLRPVLAAEDDARELRPAWVPRHLLMAAFFGGQFMGTALFALNFARLGEPRRARLTWAGGLALFLGTVVWSEWAFSGEDVDPSVRRRTTSLVVRVIVVGFGLWLVRLQEPRFQLSLQRHGRPARFWLPVLGWAFVGLVVSALSTFLLRMLAPFG